tara:strand:+ start:1093 stop:1740 length:648 start_codon:yes stop_codon:yes gene_type:complete
MNNENPIEANYDLTKKSVIRKFYEKNKIFIYIAVASIFIVIASTLFYLDKKESKNINLSNDYIEAKIYIENNDKDKAKKILINIAEKSDGAYAAMSLFLLMKENLLEKEQLRNLFDQILNKKSFDEETKNLIIFKKILFESNYLDETELLEIAKPLLNSNSLWKPHALQLFGDYFVSKKEYKKAKEFYIQILSIKNLPQEFYSYAQTQLALTSND